MASAKKYYRVEKDGTLAATEALPAAPFLRSHVSREARFNAGAATPAQKEAWVHKTFESISDRYDLMNDLESFGLHRLWKCNLVKAVSALAPSDVLDVASGTGDVALGIAKANPRARVVALDFSQNMLDVARRRAEAMQGLSNTFPTPSTPQTPHIYRKLEFVQASALDLPFIDESFDAVTISFGLRNMPDYQRSLEEMVRVLRPGGHIFCLEASCPTAPVIRQAFSFYFRYVMPAIAGLVTGKRAAYQWLNDSTELFLTKEQLAELMEQQSLIKVSYRSLALGAAALHYGVKQRFSVREAPKYSLHASSQHSPLKYRTQTREVPKYCLYDRLWINLLRVCSCEQRHYLQ